MTYKEFKEKVGDLNIYKLVDTGEGYSDIYLDADYEEEDYLMGSVSHTQACTLEIMADCEADIELIRLMLEYVITPIEERFPENLYYLRLNLPKSLEMEPRYFTQVTTPTEQYCTLGHFPERTYGGMNFKTKFTAEEVEELVTKEDMGCFSICFSIVLPEEIEAI